MSTTDVQQATSSPSLDAPQVTPEPRPELNGLMVQLAGDNRVYLVDTGYKRFLCKREDLGKLEIFEKPDPTPFDTYTITTGSDVKPGALLITAEGAGKYYLLDVKAEPGSTTLCKRWIPNPDVFARYHFKWAAVRSIPSIVLEAIPTGPDVPAPVKG